MDLVIELDNEGRIWVSGSDGTAPAEAWLHGANETPDALRASGLCLLEEKYTPGTWTSTTLDPQEIAVSYGWKRRTRPKRRDGGVRGGAGAPRLRWQWCHSCPSLAFSGNCPRCVDPRRKAHSGEES
jgi:hypothetical protein